MAAFICKRLVGTLPVVLVVALVIFLLLFLTPGDPATLIAGDYATPADIERIRVRLDTTIAAATLVFGGVLARHPKIKFLMVHGGGFVPYQAGRFKHGWQVRGEPRSSLKWPPDASLGKLYFDTLLHAQPALEFLVATCGASRVLLGSDYPFDMGTLECVRQVRALSISEADKTTILGQAAAGLL
jgi:aminocarboxymuconate-semialdehyde decarboxylase